VPIQISLNEAKILNIFWTPRYGKIYIGEIITEKGNEPAIALLCPQKTLSLLHYIADTKDARGTIPKVYIVKGKREGKILVAIVFEIIPVGPLFLEEILTQKELRAIKKEEQAEQGNFRAIVWAFLRENDKDLTKFLSLNPHNNLFFFQLVIAQPAGSKKIKVYHRNKLFYFEEKLPAEIPPL
jgi:hypothetical protein